MSFDIDKCKDLKERSDKCRDKYLKVLSASIAIYELPEEVKDTDRGLYDAMVRFLENNLEECRAQLADVRGQIYEMLIG